MSPGECNCETVISAAVTVVSAALTCAHLVHSCAGEERKEAALGEQVARSP